MRCVFYSNEDYNRDRKVWREAFDNLIKYGPLDPQTMFIQGWYHETLWQHSQDNFGEDFITRFLRYAAEESFKLIFWGTISSVTSMLVTDVGDHMCW